MHIWIVSLFPQYFSGLSTSILKRAAEKHKVQYHLVDLRAYGVGKQQMTDDRPFGGGPGMVMMIEPFDAALKHITAQAEGTIHTILTSARGDRFTQETAVRCAEYDNLVFLCGHYEGVDERVALHLADEELRIGDYVLTGGEPAALVMTDAIVRLLPGVLGNDESTTAESHSELGMAAPPQYTRPAEYDGLQVPQVLLSGDHKRVRHWREQHRKKI